MNIPTVELDFPAMVVDPYPHLNALREATPMAHVPQLWGGYALTRYEDMAKIGRDSELVGAENNLDGVIHFMGHNMMRKDGPVHMQERKSIMPVTSPKAARTYWPDVFKPMIAEILDDIAPKGAACGVDDIAARICGEAMRRMTGLTNTTWQELDHASSAMINSLQNFQEDPAVFQTCMEATAMLDARIAEMIPQIRETPDGSLLDYQLQSGLSDDQAAANVKLAISGGLNEPRKVLSGAIWALLTHPDQMANINSGEATFEAATDEYLRWVAPITALPRRVLKPFEIHGQALKEDEIVVLMVGAGNRDQRVFDNPDDFDVTRSQAAKHLSFGFGPHVCAGANVARVLVGQLALPMIFERLNGLEISGDVHVLGALFRGPVGLPLTWAA